MNKKLLAAAVVAAVAAAPAAFADSTVYGKLHTAIQYNDLEVPDGAGGKLDRSNYSVESNASRLGFKASFWNQLQPGFGSADGVGSPRHGNITAIWCEKMNGLFKKYLWR